MIKVKYNLDLKTLRDNYLKIFDLTAMAAIWKPFEKMFGIKIEELLTADFDRLVDVYLQYKVTKLSQDQINVLDGLFHYESNQPKLAWFFMNPENKFDFKTCHYCNMAYVNAYGKGDSYKTVLDFVNGASASEWRYWFKEDELSDNSISKILQEQPYSSLEDFNKKKYLWKRIEKYKRMTLVPVNNQFEPDGNHFDLDHVLPKVNCPLIRLSLFNFVPSCQVCNEKLKKDVELAVTKDDWLRISPTYSGSNFDDAVTIKLIPEVSCSTFFELMKNRENYSIEFDMPGGVYEKYITVFRLHDRYNYHKQRALHILSLKERYPEEKREEISRMMSKTYDCKGDSLYSVAQVKEDIFHLDLEKDECFSKLRNDMMERN